MRHATIAVAAMMLTAACTSPAKAPTPSASPSPKAAVATVEPGCEPKVYQDALPAWASTGFQGDTRIPHAFGRSNQIVAILFANPLLQPPAQDHNNKILWVASPASQIQADGSNLVIEAYLDGRGDPVEQKILGGPGPSIVDMPQAGCWRFALSWGGRTDLIDLEYKKS
jgi:hypothetical protein